VLGKKLVYKIRAVRLECELVRALLVIRLECGLVRSLRRAQVPYLNEYFFDAITEPSAVAPDAEG